MTTIHLAKKSVVPVVEKRTFSDSTQMISGVLVRWVDQKFGLATLKIEDGYVFKRGVKVKTFVHILAKFSPGDTSGGEKVFKTRDGTLYRVPQVH